MLTAVSRRRNMSPSWLVPAALIALALLTRIWTLGDKNIWIDETASWTEATYPLSRMISSVAGDVHPPLYYLFLRVWVDAAGDSPIALRAPSVAFGTLAVLLAWLLAGRWLTGPVRVAVVMWLAISPHLIFFAQEARMYAPATAAVLAAVLACRRWVESRFVSHRSLTAFSAAMVIALYLHYFTALILVALWIHLAMTARRTRSVWTSWVIAHVVMLALYLPWLSVTAAQVSRGQPWRQSLTVLQFPAQMFILLAEYAAGYHLRWTLVIAAAFLVIAIVLIRGWLGFVSLATTQRREPDLFLALICVVPIAISLAALPITGHMTLSRYLTYAMPLLVIAAARGLISANPKPAKPLVMIGLATIASIVCLVSYYRDPIRDFDVRPVVQAVEAEVAQTPRGRDGVVLLDPAFIDMCIKYYARQPPVRYQRVPPGTDVWDSLADAAQRTQDPIWLVVARNAVLFDASTVRANLRFEEVPLHPSWPQRIRLLRAIRMQ